MSNDLPEFTLFYYYDATPDELVEFLNKYSLREIKYHVYMLENLQAFNHFFINLMNIIFIFCNYPRMMTHTMN